MNISSIRPLVSKIKKKSICDLISRDFLTPSYYMCIECSYCKHFLNTCTLKCLCNKWKNVRPNIKRLNMQFYSKSDLSIWRAQSLLRFESNLHVPTFSLIRFKTKGSLAKILTRKTKIFISIVFFVIMLSFEFRYLCSVNPL